MKKRFFVLMLSALMLVGLSGCCLSHEWQAATCAAPETCSKCGETQGEALGHEWTAATCTAAETCSKCGETQGEALGHSWLAANYQQPERCSVCGEENGEPLTPEFVEHGLEVIDADISKGAGWSEYAHYITCGYPDDSKKAEGFMEMKITGPKKYAYSYKDGDETVTLTADELLAAMGIEPLEGYTLVRAYAEINFLGAQYGVSVGRCYEDYYTIVAHDNSDEAIIEEACVLGEQKFYADSYVVNFNGEERPAYRFYAGRYGEWEGGAVTFYDDRYYYIPEGYDGTVVGFYDRAGYLQGWPEGAHIFDIANENALFFRIMT